MILVAAGSSLPFCTRESNDLVLDAFSALGRAVGQCDISPLYETPAWPDPSDPPFINAVAAVSTTLSPEALLAALHAIEAGFGRKRHEKNAPRTLDLDLLAYHEERRDGADGGLILPHPGIAEREFVLAPLCDLAPDWRHPITGKTAKSMLEALEERSARRISP